MWVENNVTGFVVNAERSLNPTSFVLHRSACGSISSDRIQNYTTHDYVKICALDATDLHAWAREHDGGLSACRLCHP